MSDHANLIHAGEYEGHPLYLSPDCGCLLVDEDGVMNPPVDHPRREAMLECWSGGFDLRRNPLMKFLSALGKPRANE